MKFDFDVFFHSNLESINRIKMKSNKTLNQKLKMTYHKNNCYQKE